MDLGLKDRLFLVGGTTSGFGKAITEALITEGARVIGVARTEEKINELHVQYSNSFIGIVGDINTEMVQNRILDTIGDQQLSGAVVNAGGPPAGGFFDCDLPLWDDAYQKVLRWKVSLTQKLLPVFRKESYGRMLFIESVSVKQAVPSLILSNSLRAAVVGMVKTLSQEVAKDGITMNIMAPGYHLTPAMERLIHKRAELESLPENEVLDKFTDEIPIKRMGELHQFASLAAWLLSEHSAYLTGQSISVDGGLVKGIFG